MKLYVVLSDYGLNGSVLDGVFADFEFAEAMDLAARRRNEGPSYTGYGGTTVIETELGVPTR